MPAAIRHHLDIYDAVLWLAYDKASWRAIERARKTDKRPTPNSLGRVDTSVWVPPNKHVGSQARVEHVIIWIDLAKHGEDLAELVATVAHESTHAAATIIDTTNDPHTPWQLGEPFAYMVGWIARWVWDNL